MKTCFKCGQSKPHDQFYRHANMADGYLSKCKDCTKTDVSLNWYRNADVLRQTDSMRRKIRNQAKTTLNNAVKGGRIVRPATCHYCRMEEQLFAHHWDYYRPFDVTWLCLRCHRIADMARRDAEVQLLARDSA